MQRLMLALAVTAALTSAAAANDSTAELTTGGLIFVPNPDVEMRSEDLFVSAREVRVA
jgi:ABC-type nitrate/sulfonate/bicarbonate transport system substrate-binding protein